MAVLPPSATFEEFSVYCAELNGPQTDEEVAELWEWRQKLLGFQVITGAGFRSMLPKDEQHMTIKERGDKAYAEAKASGRNIEPVGARWV
jgi:hypothetical protein|tara:strand:- start:372 stop:641 length:270 start_codon:yes stop_codon:yes gene_type:complete